MALFTTAEYNRQKKYEITGTTVLYKYKYYYNILL